MPVTEVHIFCRSVVEHENRVTFKEKDRGNALSANFTAGCGWRKTCGCWGVERNTMRFSDSVISSLLISAIKPYGQKIRLERMLSEQT